MRKTAYNRIVYAPLRGGLQKTAVGLTPFVRFSSGTFFCTLKLLRSFFIAHKKTSHTAGTLCAIVADR
jgi:hypothetical protein